MKLKDKDMELLDDVYDALCNYSLSKKNSDPVGYEMIMDLRKMLADLINKLEKD